MSIGAAVKIFYKMKKKRFKLFYTQSKKETVLKSKYKTKVER